MLAIKSQQECGLTLEGGCEHVGILGIDDPALGSDFIFAWGFHQFKVQRRNLVIETEQSVRLHFGFDVALGFE